MSLRDKLLDAVRGIKLRRKEPKHASSIQYHNSNDDGYHAILVHDSEKRTYRDILTNLPDISEDVAAHGDLIGTLVGVVAEQQRQILRLETMVHDLVSAKVAINASTEWHSVLKEAIKGSYAAEGARMYIEAEGTQSRAASVSQAAKTTDEDMSSSARETRLSLSGLLDKLAKLNVGSDASRQEAQQKCERFEKQSLENESVSRKLLCEFSFDKLAPAEVANSQHRPSTAKSSLRRRKPKGGAR